VAKESTDLVDEVNDAVVVDVLDNPVDRDPDDAVDLSPDRGDEVYNIRKATLQSAPEGSEPTGDRLQEEVLEGTDNRSYVVDESLGPLCDAVPDPLDVIPQEREPRRHGLGEEVLECANDPEDVSNEPLCPVGYSIPDILDVVPEEGPPRGNRLSKEPL